jgi:outer membrane protein assembly factor BamB
MTATTGVWRWVALVAAVVVVLSGAVAGGWYMVKRLTGSASDADAGQPVPGQLRGTFPDRPSVGWTVWADQIANNNQFVRPDPTSLQYLRPGFIDLGDTLITATYLPRSDAGFIMAAIDTKTGTVRWTNGLDTGRTTVMGPMTGRPFCATNSIGRELPCIITNWNGEFRQLWYFDLADGSVVDRFELDADYYQVEVRGDDVYLLGYRDMARGTRDDPTAHWKRSYARVEGTCPGTGDSQDYGVTDRLVWFGTPEDAMVVDDRTGAPLIDEGVREVAVYPGQGYTAIECPDPDSALLLVRDEDNSPLRTDALFTASDPDKSRHLPARPWLVAPDGDLPIFIGDTAYDFDTGDVLWRMPKIEGVDRFIRIVGDVVLAATSSYTHDNLAAFDAHTGEHLWTRTFGDGVGVAASDGQRLLLQGDDVVKTINLATGELEWTLIVGGGGQSVEPAGDGFATVSGDAITFYPPTGGPSVAPGRVDPNSAGGEGGLTTKCGRTPEMRPVEYRTEGGAMVVKMEVKATCPGGDTLSSSRFRVTIRDGISPICSAVFDFSKDPVVLAGDKPTIIELTFGAEDLWRHPSSLGGRTGGSGADSPTGVTSAPATGDEIVDCEEEAGSGPAQPPGRPPTTTAVAGGEADCGTEQDALNALRAQVDADRRYVQSDLADRWVAQLSAKQPGLVAPDVDGGRAITWNACEILRQHLRLRLRYPEVRLVWSDEWRTFDLRGWWVTFAGLTFPSPDEANRWCDDRGILVDECFAKLISNSRDSRGTTKYRR